MPPHKSIPIPAPSLLQIGYDNLEIASIAAHKLDIQQKSVNKDVTGVKQQVSRLVLRTKRLTHSIHDVWDRNLSLETSLKIQKQRNVYHQNMRELLGQTKEDLRKLSIRWVWHCEEFRTNLEDVHQRLRQLSQMIQRSKETKSIEHEKRIPILSCIASPLPHEDENQKKRLLDIREILSQMAFSPFITPVSNNGTPQVYNITNLIAWRMSKPVKQLNKPEGPTARVTNGFGVI